MRKGNKVRFPMSLPYKQIEILRGGGHRKSSPAALLVYELLHLAAVQQ